LFEKLKAVSADCELWSDAQWVHMLRDLFEEVGLISLSLSVSPSLSLPLCLSLAAFACVCCVRVCI